MYGSVKDIVDRYPIKNPFKDKNCEFKAMESPIPSPLEWEFDNCKIIFTEHNVIHIKFKYENCVIGSYVLSIYLKNLSFPYDLYINNKQVFLLHNFRLILEFLTEIEQETYDIRIKTSEEYDFYLARYTLIYKITSDKTDMYYLEKTLSHWKGFNN